MDQSIYESTALLWFGCPLFVFRDRKSLSFYEEIKLNRPLPRDVEATPRKIMEIKKRLWCLPSGLQLSFSILQSNSASRKSADARLDFQTTRNVKIREARKTFGVLCSEISSGNSQLFQSKCDKF